MKPVIDVKRVYEKATPKDGYRILVDRLWPRGIKKEAVAIDEWAKDIAPSTDLRKWYDHDPEKWSEFQKRYISELKKNELLNSFLESHEARKRITLIYSARDEEHTHALVLQHFLKEHFKSK